MQRASRGADMGKGGRVFLRGITSESYGLKELRRRQLAAPRVRDDSVVVDDAKVGHSGDSAQSRTWWRIGPGDEPFLTQTLQVHFVELPPHSANHGHGHQNEATFYILEGAGYDNPDDQRAVAIVMKAKCTWMHLGLVQQGRSGPLEDEASFGPRADWSQLWSEGVQQRRKVVKPADTAWEQ